MGQGNRINPPDYDDDEIEVDGSDLEDEANYDADYYADLAGDIWEAQNG